MNEIATHPHGDDAGKQLAVSTTPSFMDLIAQNINNPNFNPEVLHRLIDANERVINRQAQMDYDAAMIKLQHRLENVKILKEGKITFSGTDKKGNAYTQETPYAKLEGIDKVLRPLMREEGFVVTYLTEGTDRVVVKCKISHSGGHSEVSSMTLPLDTSGSKNNLQGAGSSISYGRRYTLCAMLNLITVGEDDDGLGGAITTEQAAELDLKIKDCGINKEKFLAKFKVADVRDLKNKDHVNALGTIEAYILNKKRKKPETV